jgi:iron uptake system component EfeO
MVRRALVPSASIVLAAIIAACSSAGATPTGGLGSTTNAINVTATEFKFDPSTIAVQAGKVTFHVRNAGTQEHEFEIFKGDQAVAEVEGLVPGIEKDLSADLAAGTYTYECRLPGHLEQGMKGTLTVNQ